MTDAPKPRGRPRGSRNKPKSVVEALEPYMAGRYVSTEPIELHELTTTIPVILYREPRVFIDPPLEERVEWPASWRLPEQGESITLRAGFGGIVSTIDFDLERKIAVIHLR